MPSICLDVKKEWIEKVIPALPELKIIAVIAQIFFWIQFFVGEEDNTAAALE